MHDIAPLSHKECQHQIEDTYGTHHRFFGKSVPIYGIYGILVCKQYAVIPQTVCLQ